MTDAVTGTILIVDDEARNRKLLNDLLTVYGHTVTETENGAQALAAIAETSPDVVLLDVLMPDMNGFEVCRQIKTNPATGHIPVLLVTALSQRSDRLRGIEAGADDFLSKPIDREELLLRVRNALTTRRLRDQVAREAALIASEARFRGLIENSNDIIFVVNSDGIIQYLSPSYQRLTGYPMEGLISRSFFEPFEPEELLVIQEEWRRVLEKPGGTSDFKVIRVRHADGSLHLYEGMGKNLLNDPAVGAIVVNARDITERIQHEQELRTLHEQTQRRLEQLTALRQVDIAISSSMDLRITFIVVLSQLLEQLRGSAADILLLNPSMHTLGYCQGQGFRSTAIEGFHCRVGEGSAGRAVSQRETILVDDLTAAGNAFNHPELLAGEGFVSYQAAPLVSKGVVKGVLEIYHRTAFQPGPDWEDFLEGVTRQAAIAIDNSELFQGLQRSNQNLALAYDATIEGWSHALDLRDKETEGHTLRVAQLTGRLARAMGASEVELVHIRRGALLHDIGKIAIPDVVLFKPGKLDDTEWALMRRHPQIAYEMLLPIAYLHPALDIPYAHHERWDGSGYPRRLQGEQIPLAARIFAIIDVWDGIISERPYHPAQPEAVALEYIRSNAGKHFDPRVVEAFLNMDR